jgi:hypothetical protein
MNIIKNDRVKISPPATVSQATGILTRNPNVNINIQAEKNTINILSDKLIRLRINKNN